MLSPVKNEAQFLTSEVIYEVGINEVNSMDLCEAVLLMSDSAALEGIKTRHCTKQLHFMTPQFHWVLF